MELGELGFCSCEVSSFLMGFWKITILYKCCFWVRHTFGNYLWKLYFPKNYCVVTLIYIYMIIYMKMHHIWYCIWGNTLIVDMEKWASFKKSLIRKSWMLWYIIKFKDAYLVLLCGKLIENLLTRMKLKPYKLGRS